MKTPMMGTNVLRGILTLLAWGLKPWGRVTGKYLFEKILA